MLVVIVLVALKLVLQVSHSPEKRMIQQLVGTAKLLVFSGRFCLRLGVDTYSSGCGADHNGDQNRTGRPDSPGRIAELSRICAARAL